MSDEINLLYNKKQVRLSRLTTRIRLLRFISLGVLFLVTSSSVVFFLLVIATPLPSLRKNEKALTDTLAQSHAKIIQQKVLTIRLNDIATIISKRSKYSDRLNILSSKLPKDVSIKEFSLERDQLLLIITASDLKDLEEYFTQLQSLTTGKKVIENAVLNAISTKFTPTSQVRSFEANITITIVQ